MLGLPTHCGGSKCYRVEFVQVLGHHTWIGCGESESNSFKKTDDYNYSNHYGLENGILYNAYTQITVVMGTTKFTLTLSLNIWKATYIGNVLQDQYEKRNETTNQNLIN